MTIMRITPMSRCCHEQRNGTGCVAARTKVISEMLSPVWGQRCFLDARVPFLTVGEVWSTPFVDLQSTTEFETPTPAGLVYGV
jgi:hypothetical protein